MAESWRDLAVARSLDPARARAEKRVQRFLDAALELMTESPDKEFTVQEVVERSGQSLRSFYQYFAGKYELMLALFEEAIRTTAAQLEDLVADEQDPTERLHRFAVEYYKVCHPSPKTNKLKKAAPAPVLAEFGQELLTAHPKEASHAFVPMVTLFEGLLDDAARAGGLRKGLDHRHIAGIVLQAIMFHTFANVISATPSNTDVDKAAQELWDLLLIGLAL
ncbi:MAG TPA: TetR/AcrR family transcriptional regulator [Acidimicrobiales bacterium]|nr:TetR/AcrR family transcriptional regulator [Acidimicrobiales bacterium]